MTEIEPKLGYVILYVADPTKTVEFYETAFGLKRGHIHESGGFATMATGGTTLAFCAETMVEEMGLTFRRLAAGTEAPGVEIALTTPDVQGLMDRAIAAGAVPTLPVERKPWGQTVGYVRDLNGALVEICSPMGE